MSEDKIGIEKPNKIVRYVRYMHQHGMMNLIYLIDHILYQIFRFILSIVLGNMKL